MKRIVCSLLICCVVLGMLLISAYAQTTGFNDEFNKSYDRFGSYHDEFHAETEERRANKKLDINAYTSKIGWSFFSFLTGYSEQLPGSGAPKGSYYPVWENGVGNLVVTQYGSLYSQNYKAGSMLVDSTGAVFFVSSCVVTGRRNQLSVSAVLCADTHAPVVSTKHYARENSGYDPLYYTEYEFTSKAYG